MRWILYLRPLFQNVHSIWGITFLLFMACATDQTTIKGERGGSHNTGGSFQGTQASAMSAIDDEDKNFILTSIPINFQLFVELFVSPCRDGKCALEVRLKFENEIVASVALNHRQQPSSRQWQRFIWEGYWDRDGDGDPSTFILGEVHTEAAVTVAMQLVKFDDRKWAVLIRQCAGNEHPKSWYTLYEIEEDLFGYPTHKLKKIWEKAEYSGPFVSGVVTHYKSNGVIDKDSDNESLVYLEGFFNSSSEDRLDRLEISLLHWSDKRKAITERSINTLPAIYVGQVYDTIEAARSSLKKFNKTYSSAQGYPCLGTYWVLVSDRFEGLDKGKVVIAFIATSTEGVKREKSRLNACTPNIEIYETKIRSNIGD